MGYVLKTKATLLDNLDGTKTVGTLDSCLDAWIALPTDDAKALAKIHVDGPVPPLSTSLHWLMDASYIERAIELRASGELV
jgi:hypothetical protein